MAVCPPNLLAVVDVVVGANDRSLHRLLAQVVPNPKDELDHQVPAEPSQVEAVEAAAPCSRTF